LIIHDHDCPAFIHVPGNMITFSDNQIFIHFFRVLSKFIVFFIPFSKETLGFQPSCLILVVSA